MNVKRTIVTMLLLLTMAGSASALTPSWYWLLQDEQKGIQLYVDNNNVYKTQNYAVVWTKMLYPSGDYTLCQFKVYRQGFVDWLYLNMRDARGHSIREIHPGPKYHHLTIVPGSRFDALYYACYGTSPSNNY